jgi:hypothetical protein
VRRRAAAAHAHLGTCGAEHAGQLAGGGTGHGPVGSAGPPPAPGLYSYRAPPGGMTHKAACGARPCVCRHRLHLPPAARPQAPSAAFAWAAAGRATKGRSPHLILPYFCKNPNKVLAAFPVYSDVFAVA